MDVDAEAIRNKYKASADSTGFPDTSTGKKRKGPTGDDNTPHSGGGEGWPTGKDSGNPKGQKKGDGKGKERAGKGKRGGGGKGKGDGKTSSANDMLSVHAKCLIRLEQDRRDRDKASQWIIAFKLPHILPVQIQHSFEVWKKDIPADYSAHPDGTIQDVQWILFAQQVIDDLGKIEADNDEKATIASMLNFLRKTWYGIERSPEGTKTCIRLFKPVHKIRPESEQWLWALKFPMETARGRECHELLCCCCTGFEDLLNGITVRHDRAPKDGLSKALEAQLAGMRI